MSETAHTAEELAELDSISRQIDIDATADRVWALIARPGWYINEGTVDDDPDIRYEPDGDGEQIAVVTHPVHGVFRIRTVALDEPRYAAFRWLGAPSADASAGTLVEFWIEDRAEGGVTLRVLESGFSTLSDDPAVWLKQREGNVKGWDIELTAGKAYVEARA